MYEQNALAQNNSFAANAVPELGRLKAASERIAIATLGIDRFLDRFHGPRAEAAAPPCDPKTDSYRNDIESLFVAIDRLESVVSALDIVG